ncbi:MAG: bacillithiol system redox-active protein YtxJ [Crocinitomicaceae bacterium]
MENWKHITDIATIDTIIEASNSKPQILFKDSVTCGISAYAKSRLVDGNDLIKEGADFNYLDLLKHRDISNHMADVFKVHHQSPQIIVLKNEEVVYTTSHHSIQPGEIAKHL